LGAIISFVNACHKPTLLLILTNNAPNFFYRFMTITVLPFVLFVEQ